jgi:hypothetical protein
LLPRHLDFGLTGIEVLDETAKLLPLLVLADRLRVDLAFFDEPCAEFLFARKQRLTSVFVPSVVDPCTSEDWRHTGCLLT